MNLLKRVLGIKNYEHEQKIHRERLKQALARQSEASVKAETTLVDLLSKVQTLETKSDQRD